MTFVEINEGHPNESKQNLFILSVCCRESAPSLAFDRHSKAGGGVGKLQVCPSQRLLAWRSWRWTERQGLAAGNGIGRPLRRLLQELRDVGHMSRVVAAELVSCNCTWIYLEGRAARNSWYVVPGMGLTARVEPWMAGRFLV